MNATNENTMTAEEIQTNVRLGSHTEVKAALEPLRLQVEAITGLPAQYNGCGAIVVRLDDSKVGTSKAANWKRVWELARMVQAALPETSVVSKPTRTWTQGGTFSIAYDSFKVSMR